MSRHEGESRAPAPTAWASAYPARGPGATEGSGAPAGTRAGPESRGWGTRGDRGPKSERERRPQPWRAAAALSWAWSRRRGGRAAGGFALSWGGRGGGEAAGPVTGGSLVLGTHTGRRGPAGPPGGTAGPRRGLAAAAPGRARRGGRAGSQACGRERGAGSRPRGRVRSLGDLGRAAAPPEGRGRAGGKAPRPGLGQPSVTGARPASR